MDDFIIKNDVILQEMCCFHLFYVFKNIYSIYLNPLIYNVLQLSWYICFLSFLDFLTFELGLLHLYLQKEYIVI